MKMLRLFIVLVVILLIGCSEEVDDDAISKEVPSKQIVATWLSEDIDNKVFQTMFFEDGTFLSNDIKMLDLKPNKITKWYIGLWHLNKSNITLDIRSFHDEIKLMDLSEPILLTRSYTINKGLLKINNESYKRYVYDTSDLKDVKTKSELSGEYSRRDVLSSSSVKVQMNEISHDYIYFNASIDYGLNTRSINGFARIIGDGLAEYIHYENYDNDDITYISFSRVTNHIDIKSNVSEVELDFIDGEYTTLDTKYKNALFVEEVFETEERLGFIKDFLDPLTWNTLEMIIESGLSEDDDSLTYSGYTNAKEKSVHLLMTEDQKIYYLFSEEESIQRLYTNDEAYSEHLPNALLHQINDFDNIVVVLNGDIHSNAKIEINEIYDDKILRIPGLPKRGRRVYDFVPENWKLKDYNSLDFNSDGYTDYVGYLEYELDDLKHPPMILFILQNNRRGYTRVKLASLMYQNYNTLQVNTNEDKNTGYYLTINDEGNGFETNVTSGVKWRYNERYSFEYNGYNWIVTESEFTFGLDTFVTDYLLNDYKNGVGIRKYNSDSATSMKSKDYNWSLFDFSYEVKLNNIMTFDELVSSQRFINEKFEKTSTKVRVVDDLIGDIDEIMLGVKDIKYVEYLDTRYIVYTFKNELKTKEYLAVLNKEENLVRVVLAVDESEMPGSDYTYNVQIHEGKVFFNTYSQVSNNQFLNQIKTVKLNSMDLDNFKRLSMHSSETLNSTFNQLSYEVQGEYLYLIEKENHIENFYSMKLDGTYKKNIGEIDNN